jgi:long-subunit acyl-CoA synthetase (AMP-forming)
MIHTLDDHARAQPGAIALMASGISLTYAELYQRVVALAGVMAERDIRRLGIGVGNGLDWILADLAGMMSGIGIVPVPHYFTPGQVEYLLDSSHVDYLLSETGSCPTTGLFGSSIKQISDQTANKEPVKITFTSGSTGAPKGVVLRHDKLLTIARSINQMMAPLDIGKHLCILPLATLLENIAGVYAPLMKGIEICVPNGEEVGLSGSSGLDPTQFAGCINQSRPESMILVPQLLLATVTLTELGIMNSKDLKMVAVGGGKVAENLIDKASELEIPVYQGYGLSEAGSVVTLNLPGEQRKGSVGKALSHADIRVSEKGELEVSGALMEGYLGEQRSGDWLQTGDFGSIDEDGFVYITGRIKNTFITSYGRNVHPEWVEAEFLQFPAVGQCLFYGEARDENLLLVWPRFPIDPATLKEMTSKVNEGLPDYARIHRVMIVEQPLSEEFITGNGRLKRSEVIGRYRADIENQYQRKTDFDTSGLAANVL